jgi:hypothetical protein
MQALQQDASRALELAQLVRELSSLHREKLYSLLPVQELANERAKSASLEVTVARQVEQIKQLQVQSYLTPGV